MESGRQRRAEEMQSKWPQGLRDNSLRTNETSWSWNSFVLPGKNQNITAAQISRELLVVKRFDATRDNFIQLDEPDAPRVFVSHAPLHSSELRRCAEHPAALPRTSPARESGLRLAGRPRLEERS